MSEIRPEGVGAAAMIRAQQAIASELNHEIRRRFCERAFLYRLAEWVHEGMSPIDAFSPMHNSATDLFCCGEPWQPPDHEILWPEQESVIGGAARADNLRALGEPLAGSPQPDGFVWVPTYKGRAWISDERTQQLDRAFTLAKKALEMAQENYPPQDDPCCLCGGPKSQHENGTGRCTGEGISKCPCTEYRADYSATLSEHVVAALAALNELLSPPAKEEPK